VLSLEHDLAPLVSELHLEDQQARRPLVLQADDLVRGIDRVADEHGCAEARGLLDERDDRRFDKRGERGSADGGEGREQEAVRETLAVARLLPVLVVIVDRMVVAVMPAKNRKWASVRVRDGLLNRSPTLKSSK